MSIAIVYGGSLLLSGWLVARGIASRHRVQAFARLGAVHPEARSFPERIDSLRERVHLRRAPLLRVVTAVGGGALGNHMMGPVGLVAGSTAGMLIDRNRDARASLLRRDLLDGQLGEAVLTIAAAVRAGLSIRRAVAEAAREAEPPLKRELESVVDRLETGEPLDSSLQQLHARLGLSDAGLLVNALTVHRRTGGDLPALLDEISRVIRERLDDRRGIRALTVQARTSGAVLAFLPIGFVALLSGTGGDGLGDFYRSPAGIALLLVALSLQLLGFAWMRRIVQKVEAS
ncbi:MAG: type II secretion system F family protein [Actinomycetota bacterium]